VRHEEEAFLKGNQIQGEKRTTNKQNWAKKTNDATGGQNTAQQQRTESRPGNEKEKSSATQSKGYKNTRAKAVKQRGRPTKVL